MKQYFKSIRFRIWISFVVFAICTILMLFVAQSVLTPIFYGYVKSNECMSAAYNVKSIIASEGWSNHDVNDINNLDIVTGQLAVDHQFDIIVNFPDTGVNLINTKSGNGDMLLRWISDSTRSMIDNDPDGIVITNVEGGENTGADGMILATCVRYEQGVKAYIFIYSYVEPIGTTLHIINNLFFIFANVILLAACIVSIVVSSHIANPLVKISKNADKLITGNFNMKVRRGEYDEVAVLTENLNAASNEIAKTETLRKDLLANVSHDLKTPLTMIKAYAEMIRDLSGDNPEKREKHLQVIIDETDRLTLLVNDILNLSRLESGVVQTELAVFDFSGHLKELLNRFTLLDDAKDYQVIQEVEDGIYICADRKKIEQVVYNLINNAINYIGDDKAVTVRLFRKDAQTARFEVADRGVGIPAEQLPYIWDRYYKVDRSENHKRAVKGTGLGLSIVKGILTRHGFTFGCDSTVGEGSCFWFEFAMSKDTPDDDIKALPH